MPHAPAALPQRAWRDHGRRPGRCSKRCEVVLGRRRTRECARSGAVRTCVVWPKATRGCCAGRVCCSGWCARKARRTGSQNVGVTVCSSEGRVPVCIYSAACTRSRCHLVISLHRVACTVARRLSWPCKSRADLGQLSVKARAAPSAITMQKGKGNLEGNMKASRPSVFRVPTVRTVFSIAKVGTPHTPFRLRRALFACGGPCISCLTAACDGTSQKWASP